MKNINKHASILTLILGLLFISGLYLVFFFEFEEGTSAWKQLGGSAFLMFHVLVGVLLPFDTLMFIRKVKQDGDRVARGLAITGALGTLIAVLEGIIYMSTDNDWASFGMGIGFVVALISYAKLSIYKTELK